MADIEAIVEVIKSLVQGGASPAEAVKQLNALDIPPSEVHTALLEYERQSGRIRSLREPPVLERRTAGNWYQGPSAGHRFWPKLRSLLEQRGWSSTAIESLDDASTRIVSLLSHPGWGEIKTRGLVVGYVQSGKTANYSAVIAKAADAGYRLFIVLSGVTNLLRAQTQRRLEGELVEPNKSSWCPLTSITQDFLAGAGDNAEALLSREPDLRVLGVIKKNAKVMRRLLKWLLTASPLVLGSCPVLIIDDEADQATVNASGLVNSPTAINGLLMEILAALPKAAYVGYTATPFANMFIDPVPAEDLYPRDFIVALPRPEGHFGTERIFGRERLSWDEPESSFNGLDIIRIVPDEEVKYLKPHGIKDKDDFIPELTPSLTAAIQYFLLASAVRVVRGDGDSHSSMLIHTSVYPVVHGKFKPLIEKYLTGLAGRLRSGDPELLRDLGELWEEEQTLVPSDEAGERPVSFGELQPYLLPVLERVVVVMENSRSLKRLVYGDIGQVQIIIGGNILARGLTLEGLAVSFFIRAASAYDTLLQMGRWFGYRAGYADLPRIWMTAELRDYFFDMATVEQEIRNDIERYRLGGRTPLDFAVRVRTHPALAITAKLKMQAAIDCDVSYSGSSPETIIFKHRDQDWLRQNLQATRDLLDGAQHDGSTVEQMDRGQVILRGVSVDRILAFLKSYRFHENNLELRPDLLRGYIESQNRNGDLRIWNVAVMGRTQGEGTHSLQLAEGITVHMLKRSRLVGWPNDDARLGVITSPGDTEIDRQDEKEMSSGEETLKPREQGLLLLYPIDRLSEARGKSREPLDAVEDVIGVSMVFPLSKNLTPQRYKSVDLSQVPREEEEIEWSEDEEEEA
jgi:Z1 domain